MEKIKSSVFKDLELPMGAEVSLKENTLMVTKWNWDFQECLNFQKKAQTIISKNRKFKVYIFCNHPHCFTLGRGNERGVEDLVAFDPAVADRLNFPVHKIHRGGGITFHYPGQWIFYPIVSVNEKYSLEDHMCWLLKTVKNTLKENYDLPQIITAKKLMGIWNNRSKLASIGVGLNRFVTEHGLALNLVWDDKMFNEVNKINPCGIDPTTYISLNKLQELDSDGLVQNFHKTFINTAV